MGEHDDDLDTGPIVEPGEPTDGRRIAAAIASGLNQIANAVERGLDQVAQAIASARPAGKRSGPRTKAGGRRSARGMSR
jgi:hypothetical protein